MKMDVLMKHCVSALTFLTAVAFTGCNDQDFDWEKARSENAEYNYAQRFEALFGNIDPNQIWDFATGPTWVSAKTRGGNVTTTAKLQTQWDTSKWYIVDQTIFENGTVKDRLFDEGDNVDNTDLGESFTMVAPRDTFWITPIYQGACGAGIEFWMDITEPDGTKYSLKVWEKADTPKRIQHYTNACQHCYGAGVIHGDCGDCHGTGFSNLGTDCPTCSGTGSISTTTTIEALWDDEKIYRIYNPNGNSRYLYGTGTTTASQYDYAIVTLDGKDYLYSLSEQAYMIGRNNATSLEKTTDISAATPLEYSNNGNMKLGNYYVYYSTYYNRLGLSTNKQNQNYRSYNWQWSSQNATDAQKTTMATVLTNAKKTVTTTSDCTACENGKVNREECNTCAGTGIGHTSTCSYCNGTGNVTESQWANADDTWGTNKRLSQYNTNVQKSYAIRANKLVFYPGDIEPGSTIVFRIESSTKGTMKSTDPTPLILALKESYFSRPRNIDWEHKTMLIACEGSTDKDINDIIFLYESKEAPKIKPLTRYETLAKRYMVEDMGYSDPESAAAINNYTDIDFNDIVIDFEKYCYISDNYRLGEYESSDTTVISKKAVVRALGGTWDFVLYVAGKPIFQKSAATTTEYTVEGQTCPAVSFNEAHLGSGFAGFDASIMYNTDQSSLKRGDGKYPTSRSAFGTSYLCEIENGAENWDYYANNISFKIVGDTQYGEDFNSSYSSTKDDSNVYYYNFPAMGECPKIVAFDLDKENNIFKPWQREKVHVDKDWFKNSTSSVDPEEGDGE